MSYQLANKSEGRCLKHHGLSFKCSRQTLSLRNDAYSLVFRCEYQDTQSFLLYVSCNLLFDLSTVHCSNKFHLSMDFLFCFLYYSEGIDCQSNQQHQFVFAKPIMAERARMFLFVGSRWSRSVFAILFQGHTKVVPIKFDIRSGS